MFKKTYSRWNQYLTDTFVENGHNCDHMLALNSEKCNRRNETNDESNTKNMAKLPWIPVIGPKTRKELKKTEYKVVLAPTANLKKYFM